MPTSENPGVSTTKPPIASGIMMAETVVWVPRPTRIDTAPILRPRPGSSALSSDDLPAPLGPVNTDSLPLRWVRSDSIPSPRRAAVEISIVTRGSEVGDDARGRRKVGLVDDDECRDVVRLGDHEEPVEQLRNRRWIGRGDDDDHLIDIRRHRPGASPPRDPALEQRGAGFHGLDAKNVFGQSGRIEADPVSGHRPFDLALGLAPQHRLPFDAVQHDAIGAAFAGQHHSSLRAHGSSGRPAAINSSSRALTS